MKKRKKKTMALVLLLIVGCITGVGVRYSILHTKKHNNTNNHMAIYVPNDNGEGYQLSNLQKIPKGYKLNVEETNAHCSDGLTASWDDTTKTVSINATKSGGCNLYLDREKVTKCLDSNGDEITCPSTFSIGDRIAIGDEVFRFIRYTSTSGNLNDCAVNEDTITPCPDTTTGDIKVISEYNLYVGKIFTTSSSSTTISTNDENYGKQNSIAIGKPVNQGYPRYGTTEFSSDSVHGTQYSSYTGSIVENYVNEYVQYINQVYNINVTGDLINGPELVFLNCDPDNYECPLGPSWLYATSYGNGTWVLNSDNYLDGENYNNANLAGVRPVITIPASYFN